ncbi:hypothetical protein MJD09_21255 [bacterium]|nr:hypothetical protein [bacterium]
MKTLQIAIGSLDLIPTSRKRLPKSVRLGIFIAVTLAILAIFWNGTIGKDLFLQPEMEPFLSLFFREPFVLVVCVAIAWFFSFLKPTPARLEEYRLLISLPISGRTICARFLSQDWRKYAWVPAAGIVLYSGLTSVAPIPHLIRLGVLTVCCFGLFLVLNAVLHYRLALTKRGARNPYPKRGQPLIHALTVVTYVSCQLAFVIAPKLAAGHWFWIVFFGLLLATYASVSLVRGLFRKWQIENLAFVRPAQEAGSKKFRLLITNPFLTFRPVNAWLVKNLVKAKREKNVASLVLTLMFILSAYLVSMNNRNAHDVATVLLAIMGIYAFLVAFRATNQLAPDEESPDWTYSLPLRMAELYISIFVPMFGWLCLVATSFAVLLFLSEAGLPLAAWFWLKSVLVASAVLSVACAYSVKFYPDMKQSQKRFLYWLVIGIILTAAFYPYRIFVLSLMVFWPFLPFRRIPLYRVS